jgi:hypothetical protein
MQNDLMTYINAVWCRVSVASVVTLSTALRIASIVPLAAAGVSTAEVEAVAGGGMGRTSSSTSSCSELGFSRGVRSRGEAGARSLLLEALQKEDSAMARARMKENKYLGTNTHTGDSNNLTAHQEGIDKPSTHRTVCNDDICTLTSRRLFSIEVCMKVL